MEFSEYSTFDALGLAELVRTGDVSALELLDTALAAGARVNPSINAMVNVFDRRAAQAIADGLPDGPFSGVPFVLKDLWTQMAGLVTTNGSRFFAGAVAAADSEIVVRYRRAGLVIFAQTNSPEFGLSPSTEPALHGPTRNPWDRHRSAGGSSGGAAAAVAAGIVPMAHATDGGGSIRIPASCCGLFGLKPTRGRVPSGPERGEGWAGMSAQHVVSRSVRDSAAALDASAGAMPGDPYWAPPAPASYLSQVGVDPGPLRIGMIDEAPGGVEVAASCRQLAADSARRCEALGHHLVPVRWPFPAEMVALAQAAIVPANVAAAIDAREAELGRRAGPEDLEAFTAMLREQGQRATATAYLRSVQAMHQLSRAMGQLFGEIDVLLTPTLGGPPLPIGTLDTSDVSGFLGAVRPVAAFTAIANLTGQPAMSVPLEHRPGQAPEGTQFIGRFGDELTLLRLAGQLEAAHPWARTAPPLP